ncbi:MAG: hypothetical protein KKF44_08445 [Nanoarchaeota archaeon]|nr:hypothetical protein [Nanoarchaeota archaeon]
MNIFQVLVKMIIAIFKRGRGLFKFLFVIDDFFRIFTMTILIPIFFNWLKFSKTLISLGVILGLVIDAHDFMSQFGKSIDSVKGMKYGVTRTFGLRK